MLYDFKPLHIQTCYFEIESEKGININKGVEAQYWIDDFLHVRQRKDEYFNTQQTLI
jgi:hypothetical protein